MRKKLIEVALPLAAINAASAREKSIRHGHPSTLHLWWARRPLAAARAVIFAQMVDDPSEYADVLLSDPAKRRAARRELTKRAKGGETVSTAPTTADDQQALADIAAELERERLFGILRELVKWENTTNEDLLEQARAEVWQSWRRACAENADHPRAKELFDRHKLPAFHDPFAGGGALPLEAQRLGLEAHASDLNPVAVLINKAMIELPPRFAGGAPVNSDSRSERSVVAPKWRGTQGLAEDVRYYGRWMREEAQKRIADLYPQVEITSALVRERPDLKPYEGRKLTVIAWLWARTVKSPNPAFADVDVPLVSTFMLSTKKGKEAYVEPVIQGRNYRFEVRPGRPPDVATAKQGTTAGKRRAFRCLVSGPPGTPVSYEHIRAQGRAGAMGERLMAIVAEGDRGRVYLSPTTEHEAIAGDIATSWKPDMPLPDNPRDFKTPNYGLTTFGDLFTPRQLVALTTFSDLVGEATERVRVDAVAAGLPDDGRPLRDGGTGAIAYAQAVGVYLSCGVSRMANYSATLCIWSSHPKDQLAKQVFLRQALPMTWDFAETNPFSSAGGTFLVNVDYLRKAVARLPAVVRGSAAQADAVHGIFSDRVISTDPPYFDNVGYADLSDFFYVWLRRTLKPTLPELFATIAVPKDGELVASPYRHGDQTTAENFFVKGMIRAMRRLVIQAHSAFPITIYYAFKQSEKKGRRTVSTGWETFLEAVSQAGLVVTGTWPVRTELVTNLKKGLSSLAASIVLVCRRRPADAATATLREFLAALRAELPQALRLLQTGNVAPVDLAQAAIGPGMAVYTRYAPSRSAGTSVRLGRAGRRFRSGASGVRLSSGRSPDNGPECWAGARAISQNRSCGHRFFLASQPTPEVASVGVEERSEERDGSTLL